MDSVSYEGKPLYSGAAELMEDAVRRHFILFMDVDDPTLPDSDPRDVILVSKYVEDGVAVFFYKTYLKTDYIEWLLGIIKTSKNQREIRFAADRVSDCLFALEENKDYTKQELHERMAQLIESARKRIEGAEEFGMEDIRRIKFVDELIDIDNPSD